jgi:citrate lyase subunit beta / citryl-CoA lyase
MGLDIRDLRSWLFVPGDSDRKLRRAMASDADALILDLEDSVLPADKAGARLRAASMVAPIRATSPSRGVFVRINGLEADGCEADIRAAVSAGAHGLVVPKIAGADDIGRIAARVDAAEAATRGHPGGTALIPIATERPAAIFRLDEIARSHRRVAGLAWGMEDLGAELGARRTRTADGRILGLFETVRALALLAARGAGLAAIDTPLIDLDADLRLAGEATEAADVGFTGKMAIHPAQIAAINAAFAVTADELRHARAIVALSQTAGGAAFRYRDRMVDTPHVVAARRLLRRAERDTA